MDALGTKRKNGVLRAVVRAARALPLKEAGCALAGFTAGSASIVSGVAPFGISLLCAAPKKYLGWVFAGVLASALTSGSPAVTA
ncbi:MAG: hypothetical protein IK047_01835, partial [Clostridia bacterium]|nr:hypothetical protein [Clostridia bacterium]